MMFLATIDPGWIGIIGAIGAVLSSLVVLWRQGKTDKKVEEVKVVAVESLKLANGNMGTALQTNVISAQALAVAQPTQMNVEKVAEAEKQLAAHQAIKHKTLAEIAPTKPA